MPREARTIEQYRQLGTPLQTHLFRVDFEGFPPAPGRVVGAPDSTQQLSLKVMSAGFPDKQIEPIESDYGRGSKLRFAGVTTYEGTWETQFKESVNLGVLSRINAWMDYIHDVRTGTGALKENYQRDALVSLLDPNNRAIRTRRLIGLWPNTLGQIDLDVTAAETVTMSVTWSYDYWEDER